MDDIEHERDSVKSEEVTKGDEKQVNNFFVLFQ